jgi:uncharacterized protein
VSVIVPALNEAGRIEACLRSVVAQGDGVEALVVDGGSTDETVSRATAYARTVTAPRGRGAQMNAGAREATGDVLLFLHADSALHRDAVRGVRDALRDPRVVGGTFTLRFEPETPLLRLNAYLVRARPPLFHYGDQGIFVRRTAFRALDGYRELPLMEDVDFLRRLRGIGRTVLLPLPVTTSARRFMHRGVVRQQFRNWALMALYLVGVSPNRLARWYESTRR